MSWVTAPTHAVGDILTASDWNDVAGDLNILATYLGLYGTTAALVGSAPTQGTPVVLMQAGYNSTTSASAGAFSFNFPTAFPSGVLYLSMSPVASGVNQFVFHTGSATTASVAHGYAYENGSEFTGSLSLVYLAIGF